ncbi:hypothetical protein [Phaeobacter italicus]|uniref:hypothetical protein n=1 Tax=Phaeobacter italicus TaxID=481446 RepID=UPI00248EB093|nr:hypothetical protein [Phaeobacter italicus]
MTRRHHRIWTVLAFLAGVAGLSYGVWTLLTDVQKVTADDGGARTLTVVDTLDPTFDGAGVSDKG